jgi:hypothetical protein
MSTNTKTAVEDQPNTLQLVYPFSEGKGNTHEKKNGYVTHVANLPLLPQNR